MNSPANETHSRALNWVDYADSLRRGALQKQISTYAHPPSFWALDSLAAPADRVRQLKSKAQGDSAPPRQSN